MQRLIAPRNSRIAGSRVCVAASRSAPVEAGSPPAETLAAACRPEGGAGGLAGAALESYVAECVEDLQTAEIRNSAADR